MDELYSKVIGACIDFVSEFAYGESLRLSPGKNLSIDVTGGGNIRRCLCGKEIGRKIMGGPICLFGRVIVEEGKVFVEDDFGEATNSRGLVGYLQGKSVDCRRR